MRTAPHLAITTSLLLAACSDQAPPPAKPPAEQAEVSSAPLQPLFSRIPLAALPAGDIALHNFAPQAIAEVKGGGVGLIDFDRDGQPDLYLPGSRTLSNPELAPGARLFRNLGNNKYQLQKDSGLNWSGWGMGVAIGDLDGDGFEDIFTAALGSNAAHFNVESPTGRRFTERAKAAGLDDARWGMAAALGDLDNDGDLDLYVANYLDLDLNNLPPDTTYLDERIFAGPLGLTPTPDQLLRNMGDGTFEDKTFRSGIGAVTPSFGLGATVFDLNEDGQLDIFVGNDSMANFLFENVGGFAFEEHAARLGLAANGDGRDQATMGIAISDVNGDGLPDLFTTNFASDTNTLLTGHRRRSGAMSFQDRSATLGVASGSRAAVGWAALFGDFDLDGDSDLVVFNGHVYPERLASKMGSTSLQKPLYYSQEQGRFHRETASETGDWLDLAGLFRGGVRGDLDGDGDLDLVVTELGGSATVFENNADKTEDEWVSVQLEQDVGDRHAFGTRVVLVEGDSRHSQWVQPTMGFQGSGTSAVLFALTKGISNRQIEVTWPDGAVQLQALGTRCGMISVQRSPK